MPEGWWELTVAVGPNAAAGDDVMLVIVEPPATVPGLVVSPQQGDAYSLDYRPAVVAVPAEARRPGRRGRRRRHPGGGGRPLRERAIEVARLSWRPVLTAALWGLIQGLTEFLPVSSSGHLVLLPAIFGFDEPGLAASVMLHLGTLVAVVAYYRRDLLRLLHLRSDPEARRILMLLAIGTVPAAIVGLTLDGPIETVFSEPWLVAVAMMVTGGVLLFGTLVGRGLRRLAEGRWTDGLVVGLAQAFALLPGISRSGMTMTAGMAQGFARVEAARFAFLLSIPAIAGAALLDGIDLAQHGGFSWDLLVGMAVAAVVGYLAIAFLIRVLTRVGLLPFAALLPGAGAAAYFLV